jgi:hypothetical protein
MGSSPNFTRSVRTSTAAISTANTNRDGTGTLATLFTPHATYGSRVEIIEIIAGSTTTAGMIRLFIDNGSAVRLWAELDVTAITPSGTVKAWVGTIAFEVAARSYSTVSGLATLSIPGPGLLLPAAHLLKASTHNAETFYATVTAGDYDT